MNDKWTKDIHDRMSRYETDAPEGLWESIQKQLASSPIPVKGMCSEQQHASHTKHTPVVPLWAKRTLRIAAAVAVVFLVGYQYLQKGEQAATLQPQVADPYAVRGQTATTIGTTSSEGEAEQQTVSSKPANTDAALLAYSQPQSSSFSAVYGPIMGTTMQTDAAAESTQEIAIDRQETEGHTVNAAPADKQSTGNKQTPGKPSRQQKSSTAYYAATSSPVSRPAGNASGAYSFAAYTSGGFGNNLNTTGAPLVASNMPSNSQSDPTINESVVPDNFFAKAPESKRTVKHKQPVRIGISVAYSLTPRLAIESGLTYTRLSTDIKDGTSDDYYAAQQRLHYVGIPLNVKYKFYGNKHVALYGSAGALAEQCVKGTVETTTVKENTPSAPKQENTPSKPLQFSVNAAVGAQLNVSRSIGIYAEPGLSYYFDDRSSLSTIYKEKPLSFNLNVGVRVSIR